MVQYFPFENISEKAGSAVNLNFSNTENTNSTDIDEKEDFDRADVWFNFIKMNRSSGSI